MIEGLNDAITYAELSSGIDELLVSVPNIKRVEEYKSDELIKKEKELYGFYISNHPISKYNNIVKLNEISNYFDKVIDIYIYIDSIKTINTKKNEKMAFITGSDEVSSIDLIVFPNRYNLVSELNTSLGLYSLLLE